MPQWPDPCNAKFLNMTYSCIHSYVMAMATALQGKACGHSIARHAATVLQGMRYIRAVDYHMMAMAMLLGTEAQQLLSMP